MAKSLSLDDVFHVLLKEQLGYRFGTPVRTDVNSLSVVLPILRETSLKRQYSTFPETDKVLVFDTGKIDEMEVHNTTEENIFIRSGTIFRGATQERALQRSAVIFHGQKSKLNVRCIHRSNGIRGGSKVTYGGITPLNFDSKVYGHGYAPGDQASYWSSVDHNTTEMSALSGKPMQSKHSPSGADHTGMLRRMSMGDPTQDINWGNNAFFNANAADMAAHMQASQIVAGVVSGHTNPPTAKVDDLASNLDNFAKDFDHILSKVKLVENQAGLSLITDRGVETIEIFDHKDSWKALHESAVKRLGQNLVGQDKENVFDYKPEVAIRKTMEVLGLDWQRNKIYEHKPSNGEPHVMITGLSFQDYVGEVVEVNEHVVHLVVLKKAA